VEIGVTLRELPKGGGCKVSVRTSPPEDADGARMDANKLCARFGGGGHAAAAGFTSEEPPESVKPKLAAVIGELFGR
jgi:phosphoesterase RecJ-like protein